MVQNMKVERWKSGENEKDWKEWQSKGGRVKPNEWKREGRPKINDALGGGSSYNEGEEKEADGAERCKVRGEDERGLSIQTGHICIRARRSRGMRRKILRPWRKSNQCSALHSWQFTQTRLPNSWFWRLIACFVMTAFFDVLLWNWYSSRAKKNGLFW